MKKIYMILAAITLLSMSLNAQMLPSKAQRSLPINKSLSELKTDKAPNMMKGNGNMMYNAPSRANLGEGEYILGPYTTDDYSSTGWGLTSITTVSSAAAIMIGVDMELSEYQDYLGDEIVGYRFATIGQSFIYDVFILPMSETYLSTDNMIQWNLYDDEGYPEEFTTSGWHEYRLDTPIEFNFPDSIVSFWLGYEYYQFNSNQSYNKTPVAYNPNSTSHMDRMYWSGFYDVSSYIGGDIAVQLIMRHASTNPEITITPATQTINDAAGSLTVTGTNIEGNINVSLGTNTDWYLNPTSLSNTGGTVNVSYTGRKLSASNTVTATAANDNTVTASATVNYVADVYIVGDFGSGWDFNNGTQMTYNDGIYTATITANDNSYIVFARLLGNSNPWGTRDIFGPDSNGNWVLNGDSGQGTIDTNDDDPIHIVNGGTYTVIIDATDPNNVTFTITKALIPVGDDWLVMDGDYTNPNTLLSFEKDGEEIMLIDQFMASTMYNKHPDGYTYTLRETVGNEVKKSSPVDIPVYKSSSTMQGFYTLDQVMSDEDMHLKAQVLNSEMAYEVDPDHNTLYHSLYRSDLNGDYPVIDVQHRVSQLQKYEENVNGTVNYYFTETHTSGVTPRYDHVANEIVSPLDTNYVLAEYNQKLSYVPVIWTFGLYTGRDKGDGKNNSYGSDIKREILGDVQILGIGGSYSGQNNEEQTGNGWEGNFKVGDVAYCIYSPAIRIKGISPETLAQHDGDLSEYEPYMYRAWCLYEGARDFKHVAQQNAQGQTVQVLADNGPLTVPYLMGTNIIDADETTIGSDWTTGSGRLQSSFAVPVGTQGGDIKFAVRFYYKKKVTEGGTAAQGDGAKFNRDGEEDAEYYIVEETGDGSSIPVSISEFLSGRTVTGVTYVNAQGMKSSKPFDGLNIVITRYSDGTTSTTKVMR